MLIKAGRDTETVACTVTMSTLPTDHARIHTARYLFHPQNESEQVFLRPAVLVGAVQGTEGVYSLELVIALTRDQSWKGVVMFRCVQCLMLYVVCRVYVCMF